MSTVSLQPSPWPERTTEIRQLADLRPHPRQLEIFGEPPDHEVQELAASIARHGLREPIHILPDGTIIKGHARTLALLHLGLTEHEVVVRHDLADDPHAAEREFIEDNALRRQLSKLGLARAYRALADLASHEKRDILDRRPRANPLKQLAERLGVSKKNLDRYLKITRTPPEVQAAFDRGDLTLVEAASVASLPATKQAEIAGAIGEGQAPWDVVPRALREKVVARKGFGPDYERLIKALEAAAVLADKAEEVTGNGKDREPRLQALAAGVGLLETLLESERAWQKRAEEHVRSLPSLPPPPSRSKLVRAMRAVLGNGLAVDQRQTTTAPSTTDGDEPAQTVGPRDDSARADV